MQNDECRTSLSCELTITTGEPSVFVNTDASVLFNGAQPKSALNILPGGTARMDTQTM